MGNTVTRALVHDGMCPLLGNNSACLILAQEVFISCKPIIQKECRICRNAAFRILLVMNLAQVITFEILVRAPGL